MGNTLFFSTLAIAAILLFSFGISDSYSYLVPRTNLELFVENEIILVGNVTALTGNNLPGFTEYEIHVEKFLKNPQTSNTIFVSGSGGQSDADKISIEQGFMIGDRVFLLLNERDGKNIVSPYSSIFPLFNPDEEFLLPPLILFRAGIPVNEIVCKDKFELILKASDNSPACVTLMTKEKLEDRGWAIL